MPLSRRSRFSLAQFLSIQPEESLSTLLKKHELFPGWPPSESLDRVCERGDERRLLGVLDEVARTHRGFRARVEPKHVYDERVSDLVRCLELDGYTLDPSEGLRQIEPTVEGHAAYEDDLSQALRRSNLPEAAAVQAALDQSAEAFRRQPPNFNAALTDARVALQTLATSIATVRAGGTPVGFDPTKWGQVAAYLRTSGFLTKAEEDGLTGVFSFVSPGAHTLLGQSEEEMTRMGRSMVVSMCYFLVKSYVG